MKTRHQRTLGSVLKTYLLILAGLTVFLAVPASVGAQCENIDDPTSQRVKQCKKDNAKMHKLCDQKRSCKKVRDWKTALEYAERGDECAKARKEQGEKWFGGIDRRHQNVIDDVEKVAKACRDKAKDLKEAEEKKSKKN